MVEASINVSHNAEIAHRLTTLPGKCEQIHGHSLQFELTIVGQLGPNGVLAGLDFGKVKSLFRAYLDTNYDHHLLLNKNDPWATERIFWGTESQLRSLPGLVKLPGDPTIENIARWTCQDMRDQLATVEAAYEFTVRVKETNTNGAAYRCRALRGTVS
jgi:6-pyruvoyltetrahydropterin/6-carboxytetrahydropterin synthase